MAARKDVVRILAMKHHTTLEEMDAIIGSFFDVIATCLEDQEEVKLTNFGSFRPNVRPAGKRRNPRTGETVFVEESLGIRFKPSGTLKNRINGVVSRSETNAADQD